MKDTKNIYYTVNLRYDMTATDWLNLKVVFERLPGFIGYSDGCPQWFGRWPDEEKHLIGSMEPSGFVLEGFVEESIWQQWRQDFIDLASRSLGYLLMEAEQDVRFCEEARQFLLLQPYEEQYENWPSSGRHILAQYDDDSIVVYQAYRPSIGQFASEKQCFGGDFSLNRMSWIKPNFLWMMYRSGWGTKQGQEITLAIRLKRSAFDEILKEAVHSSYISEIYSTEESWKNAVRNSDVRLQWDPDHDPAGQKLERRAIQLGLRGQTLKKYSRDWLLGICDISDYVASQREYSKRGRRSELVTPKERVYPIENSEVAKKLGLD